MHEATRPEPAGGDCARRGYAPDVPKPKQFTAEFFREVIAYDPTTGEMWWKKRIGPMNPVGSNVGSKCIRGYREVSIFGKKFRLHRIAWIYVYGDWPAQQIDHINGVRDDNRIANLRDVDSSTNNQNKIGPHRESKSGVRGVRSRGDRWLADIQTRGVRKFLGSFATLEQASRAYAEAKREMHVGGRIEK